jgi:hypothetical protein
MVDHRSMIDMLQKKWPFRMQMRKESNDMHSPLMVKDTTNNCQH